MSAEILRRAAALMRERAEAATPGPWQVAEDVDTGERFVYDTRWTELAQVAEWSTGLGNPHHIASWHPVVALAVATWLDSHADIHALRTCDERLTVPCPALSVAHTYLGEQP